MYRERRAFEKPKSMATYTWMVSPSISRFRPTLVQLSLRRAGWQLLGLNTGEHGIDYLTGTRPYGTGRMTMFFLNAPDRRKSPTGKLVRTGQRFFAAGSLSLAAPTKPRTFLAQWTWHCW